MAVSIVRHDRLVAAAVSRFGFPADPALSFDYEHEHCDAEYEHASVLALIAAAHHFVQRDGDGGREVEAADAGIGRQPDGIGPVGLKDRSRQAGGFAAKHDHVAGLQIGVPNRLLGKAAEVPVTLVRQTLAQLLPGGDFGPLKVLPVIEPCAADPFFVDLERRRLDDPEHRAGGDAGAADVAGVLRDLRLIEDDVGQWRGVWLRDRGGSEQTVRCSRSVVAPIFPRQRLLLFCSHADRRHLP